MRIKPENLNLSSLPFLALDEKSAFPSQPAIYFCIDRSGKVQYIGQTKNLQARWLQHHRSSQLENIGNVKIAYLEITDINLLIDIEKALIDWFKPSMNGTEVISDKVRVSTYIPEETKIDLEKLASARDRSVSNLIERLIKKEIADAKAKGEI